jgi:hypothetical protein
MFKSRIRFQSFIFMVLKFSTTLLILREPDKDAKRC